MYCFCRQRSSAILQDAEIANITDEIARFQSDRSSSSALPRFLSSNASLLEDPLTRYHAINLTASDSIVFNFFAGCHQRLILLKEMHRNTSKMVHRCCTAALLTMVRTRKQQFNCVPCSESNVAAALKLRLHARRSQVSVHPQNLAASAVVPSKTTVAAAAAGAVACPVIASGAALSYFATPH